MARIANFGANGAIGHRVVSEALDRGHTITAVVRDPASVSRTHRNLTVVTGDVLDPASVSLAARDQDVLVSAVGGGDGPGHRALLRPAAESLVAGLHTLGAGAPRLIVVGGAGSLRVPGGGLLQDTPGVPEDVLLIMRAHADALAYLRRVAGEIRWTCLSPAACVRPGRRTGRYETGLDELVTDARGQSAISLEDYAVALVDEIEKPRHLGERFTVAHGEREA
ncbi:NAD(P)-dependent oxidoreductase [Streptomyces specialis]|uniref:NAD(P)-dependent oxidoreductase n=1 Tax=Streptomyces specialis TaxID=498367 RepID=UPI00073EAB27|nr:NAD(P)H-binding protein [Streptomyces specialis]